ncbi:MAG: T9SS type A sorting domain-containing protein [Ignavibacteriae bacterium]|nr:T9SS type A sorting domain-containing protein [Ignavibacteriota bacterium]
MKKIYFLILVMLLIPLLSSFGQGEMAVKLINDQWKTNGDFVYCGSCNYDFTGEITVAAWVKWTYVTSSYTTGHEQEGKRATIVTIDGHIYRDQGQFWLHHSDNNTRFEWAVKTTSGTNADKRAFLQSTTAPEADKWYYLSGTYKDNGNSTSDLKFYVNGVLENSAIGTTQICGNINTYNSDYKLNIGRVSNGYRFFTGSIDEIRIWNKALTQDEIIQQMYSKSSLASSNLKSYWDMDNTTGSAVDDKGTANFDGVYYTALVDVHDFDVGEKRINDDDKAWTPSNCWAGLNVKTVAGAGWGESNEVVSNTGQDLRLKTLWINTPIKDDLGNQNNLGMTWFGIQAAAGSTSQWVTSTTPVGSNSTFITSTSAVSAGPVGGKITMTITNGSTSHAAMIFQLGSISGSPVTTEIFPGTYVTKRSNIYWGYHTWGSPTGNFVIDFSNVAGTSATVKLLRRTRNGAWEDYTSSAVLVHNFGGVKTFTVGSLANGSYEFALGENNDAPLPVELTSFTSSLTGNTVTLNWSTGSEINNHGFEIQRFDSDKWISAGFVQGKGTVSTPSHYDFTDRNLKTGIYKYRIKQIDNNGNFEYFELANTIEISAPAKFNLSQNYPNPFNPVTKIDYQLPADCRVSVKIYDLTGREVMMLFSGSAQAGYHTLTFDGSKLASGIYIYKINAEGSGTAYSKIMKLSLIK